MSGYIGGALLITIGAWVLIQAFRAGGQAPAPPATTTRLLLMAFALSMDNLVVGFSLGVQHIPAADAVAVFAAVTAFLSMLGLELGRRIGAAVESGAEYLAGIVLMVVGVIVATGYP